MVKDTTKNKKDNKGIHTKLNLIMADIGVLKKDKKNEHFKYSYLSEEAIKKAVQPLLVKHGVNFQLDIKEVHHEGNRTTVLTNYLFTDIETGESVEGEFAGVGVDNQDKGIWKALTGALKYILTSTFLIPTGDDVEAASVDAKTPTGKDAPAPQEKKPTEAGPKMISEPQMKKIRVLIKELDKDDVWFKGWIKKDSIKDLTMAEATQYIELMQKKVDDKPAEFGTCDFCGVGQEEAHLEGCELAATQ